MPECDAGPHVHWPATQEAPTAQAMPQPPQLFASVCGSMHSVGVTAGQASSAATQEITHVPCVQM